MTDWQNEDEIKAELRMLTRELRQLREELRGMVTRPKPHPARALLHRQSWPSRGPDAAPAEADDVKRRRAKPRQKK